MKTSSIRTALVAICLLLPGCQAATQSRSPVVRADLGNLAFSIDGQEVKLTRGRAEQQQAPDSSSRLVTEMLSDLQATDLDGDGLTDVVVLLTQGGAGTGTFYYVAAALRDGDSYTGSNATLLGDRIRIKGVSTSGQEVTVRYFDRDSHTAMGEKPLVETVKTFLWNAEAQQLIEAPVTADEAPNNEEPTNRLTSKTWTWIETSYNNDTQLRPNQPDAFSLTFNDDSVAITTDCNSMRGRYVADANRLQFHQMIGTRMFCDGSQEHDFAVMLDAVQGYLFSDQGDLVLELKLDSGVAIFR